MVQYSANCHIFNTADGGRWTADGGRLTGNGDYFASQKWGWEHGLSRLSGFARI